MDASKSNKQRSSNEIIILHNGDQHLCFENRELIKKIRDEYVKQYGSDSVFLLNTGDIFPFFEEDFVKEGITINELISWMNELGYSAMTLGNHDYDNGNISYRNGLAKANFPILCANFPDNSEEYDNLLPYIIFEVCDKKIIIFGISRLRDTYPVHEIKNFIGISDLRKKADIFIALSHLGLNRDEKLANELPKEISFDLIIGGHTHDILFQDKVNGVFISHALNPNYLGRLIVNFDNESRIQIKNGLISLRKYNEDYCKDFRIAHRSLVFNRRRLCQQTNLCWDQRPKDDVVYRVFYNPRAEE